MKLVDRVLVLRRVPVLDDETHHRVPVVDVVLDQQTSSSTGSRESDDMKMISSSTIHHRVPVLDREIEKFNRVENRVTRNWTRNSKLNSIILKPRALLDFDEIRCSVAKYHDDNGLSLHISGQKPNEDFRGNILLKVCSYFQFIV